jgi:hypothetical protein
MSFRLFYYFSIHVAHTFSVYRSGTNSWRDVTEERGARQDFAWTSSLPFSSYEYVDEAEARNMELSSEGLLCSILFFPELSVSDLLLIFDLWWFVQASNLFELHLYTMGNKLYATEMAKVLDPTGTLFAGRVISRGDDGDPFDSDERVPKSKDLDGVLGMESAVVIIDDSVRVWPHNRHNLIVVERYASVLSFFLMKCCQMHLPNPLSMWFSADTPISPAAGVNLAFLDHHF